MLCVKLLKVPPGHGCRSGLFVSDSVLHCAETGGYKEKVINHRDEKVNPGLSLLTFDGRGSLGVS